VIESFKHKGLKRLFEEDDRSKLAADMVEKIRLILSALESADSIDDLNQPSFRLHPLKGDLKGNWAVTVRANWRIVFRFEGNKASNVDLVDYH
jgi:toxin HigB-1